MSESQTYEEFGFANLIDLASAAFGGEALWASDEFFAGRENLLKVGAADFFPHEYTDRGKWMDGWESARTRRHATYADRDECIIRLGVLGRIRVINIDTHFFLGNHPPYARVEGVTMPRDASVDTLKNADWRPILAEVPLRPGAHNLFAIENSEVWTHLRLTMIPDGGVARFRAFGDVDVAANRELQEVDADTALLIKSGTSGWIDFAALRNGGRAIACSDMFFGRMESLLLPGRAGDMGSGWETKRRRNAGVGAHDWVVIALGALCDVGLIEIDTNHFRGNAPDSCTIEAARAEQIAPSELIQSRELWKTIVDDAPIMAHTRHWFSSAAGTLTPSGPASHIRLKVFPDGGVSRMRVWGSIC